MINNICSLYNKYQYKEIFSIIGIGRMVWGAATLNTTILRTKK